MVYCCCTHSISNGMEEMLNMEKSWIYNLHIDVDISDDDGKYHGMI